MTCSEEDQVLDDHVAGGEDLQDRTEAWGRPGAGGSVPYKARLPSFCCAFQDPDRDPIHRFFSNILPEISSDSGIKELKGTGTAVHRLAKSQM